MKLIFSICTIAISLFLFSSCKSEQSSDNEKTVDNNKMSKDDSAKIVKELNKYQISPPDPDYTGDYIDRYPNGVIKFTGFFRFGVRHGEWMAFYDNGTKWSNCFYEKGKKHGATEVFHPNGKLLYSGWYKDDQKDSLWLFYDDKGKEVDRRAYRMGVETGLVY